MKKEKRFVVFLFGVLVMFLTNCSKDYLSLNNPNANTVKTFWKSEADVQGALAACYNLNINVFNGYWGYVGTLLKNGRGDDVFQRNDDPSIYRSSIFTNTPDNGLVDRIWRGYYKEIFRCNQIIENVPNVPMSNDKKEQYISEAKFLRGLSYFILTINFGSIPLRLKVPHGREDYYVAKSSQDSVYLQIFQDLTDASKGLPLSYPDEWVGRATKGAAIGYLGKAYLYHKDFAKAQSEFERIMKPPFQYDLMENYADNFDLDHENNKESVFEIQLQDIGGTDSWNSGADQSLGSTVGEALAPAEVSGWYEMFPTNKLFNEFQQERTINNEADPRMVASIVWEGERGTFYQKPISDYFPTQFGLKARFKKYQNWTRTSELVGINGGNRSSSINETALRFDDILLMHAEAVTLQGRPQDAYNDVNRIRKRAHLSDLSPGYSENRMMEEVRHQRMIEFAREGLRFYDLRRWGLLQEEIENSDKIGKEFFDPQKHKYYPIPQEEIDANPKMTQQPGW